MASPYVTGSSACSGCPGLGRSARACTRRADRLSETHYDHVPKRRHPPADGERHEGADGARRRAGATRAPALPRAGHSGQTSERVFVYRKTKQLKTFTRPLRTTDDAVAYWVGFSFAKSGSYRYFRRRAGNRRCATIRIR